MLINLHVKNLALIEETEVDFHDHLNILTGETGAGKSILIGSIQSALGGKIPKDMIRMGADSALIELIFHSDNPIVLDKLQEYDIPCEEGEIILSRRITNQRVINKVNDCSITVSKLKELAPLLLDLSGQHDNQLLLQPLNHLAILDSYGKDSIGPLLKKVESYYHNYQKNLTLLKKESLGEEERLREMEFLKYEIQEITQAKLSDGEDELLEQQYYRMNHSKEILESCHQIYQNTGDGENDASEKIGQSIRLLSGIVEYDEQMNTLEEQLNTIDALLNDFNRELSEYISSMEFDEECFRETEERLDQINHLKAKYGNSISKINEYAKVSQEKYDKWDHYEEYVADLKKKTEDSRILLEKECLKLTKAREKAAIPLMKSIKEALLDLNFNEVRFEIAISQKEYATINGKDEVCFMISTNPGMPIGPLHEVASGGELSRVMLAIKSILADEEQIETLIFDEIDTGISGRTAQKVSERLACISKNRQVIAITHLPQIAAMADAHYLIEKISDSHSTISNITQLTEEESVTELARMLGGAQITDAVIENAKEMKDFATHYREIT